MVSQTEIKALVSEQGWGLCRSSVTMYSARCGTLHVRLSVSASALLSHQNQCCHIPWGGDRSPRAQRKLPQQVIFLLRAHSCCLPCFCETHRQDANKRRDPPKGLTPKDTHHFRSPEMLLIFHSIARIKNMSVVEKETIINTPAVLDSGRLRSLGGLR